MIDLTSFGKIDVSGPGALALLQRACANDIDKPLGSTIYGQFLDQRGGIVADVTTTRRGAHHFRGLTRAGYPAAVPSWPVGHMPGVTAPPVVAACGDARDP